LFAKGSGLAIFFKRHMNSPFRLSSPHLIALAVMVSQSAIADPMSELAGFSSFKTVNLEKLAAGNVQSTRGPSINFTRGLAVESCYVIPKPLARAIELHLKWTPLGHSDLKVWLHSDLPAHPTPADFQQLRSAPGNGSVKAFVAAAHKAGAAQLSKAEAQTLQAVSTDGAGSIPPGLATFWSNVLAQRAQAFLSGGLAKLAPYETSGETIRPVDELARLLKEVPKVRGQFASLIEATPVGGGKGSPTPSFYWEMFDVEGQGAVNLAAVYSRQSGESWQSLDLGYYASDGYYVRLTLTQMWPLNIGGKENTLVWQGDLVSSGELGSLRGVERMGSSTAMMRETQKFINRFLADAAKSP
jgi:hypothetical protein